jgi:MFS family permease
MYAELFPAPVRGSGTSLTYALGAILGGAFAPTIAAALVQSTGSTYSVTVYLCVATAVGFLAAASLQDRTGVPLNTD